MEEYQYKDSGIEWLGEIPKHWEVDRLKDQIFDVVGGDWGDNPDSSKEGEVIIVLRVSDINQTHFSYDDLTYRKISKTSLKSREVDERSLLIEKSGGGKKQKVGRVAYPKRLKEVAICSNFMARVQLEETVDIRFFNYLFKTLYDADLNVPHIQQTTGIQNLNIDYYLQTKTGFPPLSEQKAIANYLDTACRKIDNVITIKGQQIEKISNNLRSNISELFTRSINDTTNTKNVNGFKYLGEVPANWKVTQLKFVFNFLDNERVPISSADRGAMVEKKYDYYGASGVIDKVDDYIFDEPLLLLGEDGANLLTRTKPLVFIANGKYWVNNHAHVLKPKFGNIEFWRHLLENLDYSLYVTGSAQPKLTNGNLRKMKIAFPEDLKERQLILNKIKNLESNTFELKKNLREQIKTLKSFKKSLIHECVTGKKQVFEGADKASISAVAE